MGGQSGDLHLVVEVLPHSRYKMDGSNLTTEVKIDLFTAVLGGTDQRIHIFPVRYG